jgi:uncharacterized cupredoxin-like copper-binding protein
MYRALSLLLAAGLTAPAPTFKPAVITVRASEFAFTAPKSAPAGTITLRMVNDGKQLHHVAVVKLLQGRTVSDFVEAMKKPGPPPAWAVAVGGPNAAVPGQSTDATLTLEPGNYALVCFVPSPGDPTPHVMKGMISALTVTPSSAPSADLPADVTIRLSDYKFALSKPLSAGRHTIRVTNDAAQDHEVLFIKLPPRTTSAGVAEWVEAGMKGPPPAMPIGGVSPLARGRSNTITMELTPGTYGMVCFLPDAKDGKPHSTHGMTAQFEVK